MMVGRIAAIVLLAIATLGAATLPPVSSLEELSYSSRVWQGNDGLPEDLVQALAQTPDGYLWIGSSGGLVRFDGVRFTVFGHANEPAFRDDSVFSLLAARDGSLWIGTKGGGLLHYAGGTFRTYGVEAGLTNGFVRVIYEDRAGKLWVGTDKGLFRRDGERLVRVDGRDGIPVMSLNAILEDRQGRLLVGGTGFLMFTKGGHEYYPVSKDRAGDQIRAIAEDSEGTIWLGAVANVRRLAGGVRGNPFEVPRFLDGVRVSEIYESGEGIWIGTHGHGLLRWKAGNLTRIAASGGLPHDDVLSITADREGNTWVGTQAGLVRISPSAARTLHVPAGDVESINTVYADPAGGMLIASVGGRLYEAVGKRLVPFRLPAALANVPIRNAFRARDGSLWLGTIGRGVYRLEPAGTVRHFSVSDGLINDFTRAFCEARDGSLWIGTNGGISHFHDGRFENYNADNGLAYNSVRAVMEDSGGVVWIGTEGGITRYSNGGFLAGGELDSLRGQKVWALYEDPDGGVWIGTHGTGLYQFRDGRLTHLSGKQGLADKIHFIGEDGRGNLWLSSSEGIISVSRRAMEEASGRGVPVLTSRLFNTSDGLATNQMNGGMQSSGAVSSTGEIWVPSTAGVVVLSAGATRTTALPQLLLEKAIAGDTSLPIREGGRIEVQPGTGKLELHYTAIRLRSPERLRFRYWMEGAEAAWNQVGDRRIAYFTNLSPGNYRFHVAAWDVDEPARTAERVFAVTLLPAYYQTWWFMLLLCVVALSLGWGGYGLHVRNVRRQFEAVLEERSRVAREMHDTVIQGCVGISALLEAASSTGESAPDVSHALIERARDEIRTTVEDARTAVWNLRHSEQGGRIGEAIASLVQRVRGESGMAVELETVGSGTALGPEAERGVVLSTREALSNAVRHSGATRIVLTLHFAGDWLSVDVLDNGAGFEWSGEASGENRHYGLIGMKERMEKLGGSFGVDSTPGQGTRVRLRVPLSELRA